MDSTLFVVTALFSAVIAGVVALGYLMHVTGVTRARLYDQTNSGSQVPSARTLLEMGILRRWLYLAGFRRPAAPMLFVVATLTATTSGIALTWFILASGLRETMAAGVEAIPGGVGGVFIPLVAIMPYFVGILLGLMPWLYVRAARRRRVELLEQDLPLALELLATLSEAGLAFDAALSRILQTRLADRPLAEEFHTFQADVLAGRPRVQSLRRFSQRIQISSVSIFISALAQAEQIGMGISTVLRRQADDLRNRRRERANAFAASLPVKRMLPLVSCFLPGLFVWTLGPFFVQLFKIADTFIQVREF